MSYIEYFITLAIGIIETILGIMLISITKEPYEFYLAIAAILVGLLVVILEILDIVAEKKHRALRRQIVSKAQTPGDKPKHFNKTFQAYIDMRCKEIFDKKKAEHPEMTEEEVKEMLEKELEEHRQYWFFNM